MLQGRLSAMALNSVRGASTRSSSSSSRGHIPRAPQEQLRRRSLWESYRVLSPNTRLALSLSLLVFAYGGLKLSDYLQEEYPEEIPSITSKSQQ